MLHKSLPCNPISPHIMPTSLGAAAHGQVGATGSLVSVKCGDCVLVTWRPGHAAHVRATTESSAGLCQ